MANMVKMIISIALSIILLACNGKQVSEPTLDLDEPPPIESLLTPGKIDSTPSEKAAAIVMKLPVNASVSELKSKLELILREIFMSPVKDCKRTSETIQLLKKQPNIVPAFVDYYISLPRTEYDYRLFTIQVLGDLRHLEALVVLQLIAWQPLPKAEPMPEGFSTRDFEEMIQINAVHGIAYLRTSRAYDVIIDIMNKHESKAVRIAAINSYMWNRGDSKEEAKKLYKILPTDLYPYIDQPRFHRNMDTKEFNQRLQKWRGKWVQ